jgi:imidazolonepropionase-like amidohydrolase
MRLAPVLAPALLAGACHSPLGAQHATPATTTAGAPPAEQARFVLYKFGQGIGTERATIARGAGGSSVVKTTFTFNDRGTDVPLAAHWQLLPDGTPSRYEAWGFTARGVSIDDRADLLDDGRVEIARLEEPGRQIRVPAGYAAASGYAPVIGQELLVRRWIARGRPATMRLVPEGDIRIQSRGRETYTRDDKPVAFEHLAIFGLVWGREDVWIDDKGELQGVVTRDAEFDHFEAMRARNVGLIDELVRKAGDDAVAWLAEAARANAASPPGPLALVGARLVDGSGALPIEDATVVVDGDRILAAGPRATTGVPAGARRVDVAGATIVPGLWDMHAHVEQVEQAAAYLAAGVTTVRDEGNILPFITAVRDAVETGRGVGPRVIVDCLVDSDGKRALGTLRVNATDDIAPVVDRAVQAGCAEIKIYSSLKPQLVAPLCAEAHRRGLRVTGHVPTGMDINDALDAGFDGVNHIHFVTSILLPKTREELELLSRDEQRRRVLTLDLGSERMQNLFKRMAKQKTVYDPTVALSELFLHPAAELAKREPGLAKLPRELRGNYGAGMNPEDVDVNHRTFEKFIAAVREMHRLGVIIVAGTDIAVPGHSLHREIELYVEAGFSTIEALQAATIVPARMLGRDRELGTVTVGKRADLVVVDGNPLADIHALRKVRLVVARGRAYDPATMWTLAGFQP